MTKLLKYLSISLVALLVILPSCYRIEEMSDFNQVHTLDILSFSSETIEIGGFTRMMEIGGTQVEIDVIYIDVEFGEHLFPLRFYANPIIQGEIDRVIGIDFSEELVLETPDCELRFYVMAISGLSRVYTIRTRIVPLENNVSISRFFQIVNVEPAMLVSEQGVISGDTLRMFTIGGSGPVTITPRFQTVAESTYFSDITSPTDVVQLFANGEMPLSFNRPEDAHRLRVVSESGIESTWHIMVYHTPMATGAAELGAELDERDVSTASQTENFEVQNTFVNVDAGEILLAIRDAAPEPTGFPLEVVVVLDVPSGLQVVGLENTASFARTTAFSASFVFEGWDDEHIFYVLDTETFVSRQWRVVLQEVKSSENIVLDFQYTFSASTVTFWSPEEQRLDEGPAATLSVERTTIFSRGINGGDIFLAMVDLNNAYVGDGRLDNWELTLNVEHIATSNRATIGELPSFVWTGNGGWGTPQSFEVIAQDGSVRTWLVHIEDVYNRVPYADAELKTLTITNHAPSFAVFDAVPVTISSEQRVVTLNLVEDHNAYPLQVWFSADLSTRAQIMTQNNGTGPLVFQNENDTQTITVRAEDGTIVDWTVRLQPPSRSAEAQVLTFNVSNVSGAFMLANTTTTIHPESREIRIRLTSPNPIATSPVITYAMTISDRATATVSLGGTFNFSTFRQRHTFRITAEDGTTTQDWTVRLIYEPQLFNWNLDSWSLGSAAINVFPHGWATANFRAAGMFDVENTTRVAGNPASGGAAQLRTNAAPIIGRPGAGTLFLGTFDASNAVTFQNDPIRITRFGLPFGTSGHIRGISVDVKYQAGATFIPGTTYHELGSATIELVKPDPSRPAGTPWVYHGHHTAGHPHDLNTAIRVANREMLFGNTPGVAWTGESIKVVSPTEWTTVEILFDFPGGVMPDFTHLSIVFSSSARGDLLNNNGVNGSTLTIDNIRILYKEED